MKRIIKNTIEYQSYKKGLLSLLLGFLGTFLILCMPFLALFLQNGDENFLKTFIVFLIIDFFAVSPFIFYCSFRLRSLLKIGDKMKISETQLNDFESGIYGLMVFFIEIPNSNGSIEKKRSLCSMRGKLFNVYKNAKVKVCYLDGYRYFFIIKKENDL